MAIQIREEREEEGKRVRRSATISVLSLVGVPLGFLVAAYFGINAQQIDDSWSMFDWHRYLYVSLAAGIFALIPIIFLLVLNLRAWLRIRLERQIRQLELEKTESAKRTPRLSSTG